MEYISQKVAAYGQFVLVFLEKSQVDPHPVKSNCIAVIKKINYSPMTLHKRKLLKKV